MYKMVSVVSKICEYKFYKIINKWIISIPIIAEHIKACIVVTVSDCEEYTKNNHLNPILAI